MPVTTGPQRKALDSAHQELLKKYGSLKKMTEASISDLEEILPTNVASDLHDYLISLKGSDKNE